MAEQKTKKPRNQRSHDKKDIDSFMNLHPLKASYRARPLICGKADFLLVLTAWQEGGDISHLENCDVCAERMAYLLFFDEYLPKSLPSGSLERLMAKLPS